MTAIGAENFEAIFLHGLNSSHDHRVVALQLNPFLPVQNWTVTDRGSARFTIHTTEIDGTERYLTAPANGVHVFTTTEAPSHTRQIWRFDQGAGAIAHHISLGRSGRFLQADQFIEITIKVDNGKHTVGGFDVDLVKEPLDMAATGYISPARQERRPQATPHPVLGRPSACADETGSAASSTITCRPQDVARFSAPHA